MVNISENNLAEGGTLVEFVGSGAPFNTGLHNYIFLVFEQKEKVDISNLDKIRNCHKDGRFKTKTTQVIEDFRLSEPVFGNYYQAEYDDYVPQVQALLSQC